MIRMLYLHLVSYAHRVKHPERRTGMYIVFNAYMAIMYDDDQMDEAIRCAANNAAKVISVETDECLADFRTPESEADERG